MTKINKEKATVYILMMCHILFDCHLTLRYDSHDKAISKLVFHVMIMSYHNILVSLMPSLNIIYLFP